MKKRWFRRNLTNFGVGVVADFNADEPGGMVGAGAGGDNVGDNDGGDAGGETMHQEAGSSSDDDASSAGEGDNSDDATGADDGADDGADSSTDDSSKRFDALESKFSDLMEVLNKEGSANSDDDGSDDLSGLEHEDLVTMMADDPAGFIGKLTAEIEKSVTDKVARDNANSAYDSKVESTINAYADANKDFEEMWDNGDIKAYMEDNPGHNALSAHMAMTMEAKLAEATKKGEETAVNNFRTKSNNQVLNGGPGIPPEQRDAALKDPSKFGGAAAVLAMRAGIQ